VEVGVQTFLQEFGHLLNVPLLNILHKLLQVRLETDRERVHVIQLVSKTHLNVFHANKIQLNFEERAEVESLRERVIEREIKREGPGGKSDS
jgi:hypothetical protein